jgi:uncharacterized FlaG/YvyC family protein
MNIRSITGVISPYFAKVREKTANESGADRDAQPDHGGNQKRKSPLTEEELLQVQEYVRELPGFAENNLSLRVQQTENVVVLFIEDPQGKVIRRMAEAELLDLLLQSQTKSPSTKGRILNKAV